MAPYKTDKKSKSRKRSSGVKVHDPSDRKATTRGRTSENRAKPARSRKTAVATSKGRTSENRARPARKPPTNVKVHDPSKTPVRRVPTIGSNSNFTRSTSAARKHPAYKKKP